MQVMEIVILAVIFLLTFLLLFYWDKKKTQQEKLRMEKMRNSKMYEGLYPFVRRLRRRRIEEVTISPKEVEFLILLPVRRRIIFSFELRKHQNLSNQRAHTLCLLLQNDIPMLRDKSRYQLKKISQAKSNGDVEHIYTYTMKTAYKDALFRNPLYANTN